MDDVKKHVVNALKQASVLISLHRASIEDRMKTNQYLIETKRFKNENVELMNMTGRGIAYLMEVGKEISSNNLDEINQVAFFMSLYNIRVTDAMRICQIYKDIKEALDEIQGRKIHKTGS